MRETQNPCSHGAYVLMGEVLSKQILIIYYTHGETCCEKNKAGRGDKKCEQSMLLDLRWTGKTLLIR